MTMSLEQDRLKNWASHTARRPVMLWCSSHGTLSHEEIPLFIQAGFRVIPLLTDMWTFKYRESLDGELNQAWKETIDLPKEVIRIVQALELYSTHPNYKISDADIRVLNEHIDVLYVTVLPNTAIRLAERFAGTVIFRPFGHGHINNYSRVARSMGITDLEKLRQLDNFIWCPILSTLQDPEEPALWKTPLLLGPFVTPKRVGAQLWRGTRSKPIVAETIPRITAQLYYREIYDQYVKDFGDLPIQILGSNPAKGGDIDDPRIIGRLDDGEYYKRICEARISIYHGQSHYHVHYHPLEYMAMGVPVLFHCKSAIAAEAHDHDVDNEQLALMGMYHDAEEAKQLAQRALRDISWAVRLSEKQKFFTQVIYSRERALYQARWLRNLCSAQLRNLYRTQEKNRLAALAPKPAPSPIRTPALKQPRGRKQLEQANPPAVVPTRVPAAQQKPLPQKSLQKKPVARKPTARKKLLQKSLLHKLNREVRRVSRQMWQQVPRVW